MFIWRSITHSILCKGTNLELTSQLAPNKKGLLDKFCRHNPHIDYRIGPNYSSRTNVYR